MLELYIWGRKPLLSHFCHAQALRLQLGVEVGSFRTSLVTCSPSCHLPKSTAARGEHTPRLPSIFRRMPRKGVIPCGDPFFLWQPSQPAMPGSAAALCPSKPGWARGVTGVVLGSHSLDSRHVWGRHGADFFGFLKGVLLVKGLLFLLLILRRKEGHCSVGCWGSKGKLSRQEQ